MHHRSSWLAVAALLALPLGVRGQQVGEYADDPTEKSATATEAKVPRVLLTTLEALGASDGVPDGAGFSWYPTVPISGQPATMGYTIYQLGLTEPVYKSDDRWVIANAATRYVDIRTNAILPDSRVRFPSRLWDVQFGGGYIAQLDGGRSWGVFVNAGTVSDKPFHSLAEDTISSLAYYRMPGEDKTAWWFYVVSATNGQVGRNIPIPGLAYEFDNGRIHGIVGFPFLSVTYRPIPEVECQFDYAAITDIALKVAYWPLASCPGRVFGGFEWTNMSWFRADREVREDQLFLYEKRVFGGLGSTVSPKVDVRVTGGYAFDRYFVENSGFSLSGRNRVDLGAGPFVSGQVELKY